MTETIDTAQPEALRIAAALEYCDSSVARQAINELRRLHSALAAAEARNATLTVDAARYQFLRDGEWRDTDLEPTIRLQLNVLWDAKIDAFMKEKTP